MEILQKFDTKFWTLLQKYKVEFLTIAIFSLLILFVDLKDLKSEKFFPYFCFYFSFLFIVFILRAYALAYKFSFLVPICGSLLLYFYDENLNFYINNYKFWATNFIIFTLFLSQNFSKNNQIFVENSLIKLINLAICIILSHIFIFLFWLVFLGSDYLFRIEIMRDLWIKFYLLTWFFIAPSLFLFFDNQNFNYKINYLARLIINYALTPFLILYTILLYFYIFKIAIFADLPKGGVALITLIYLCGGLLLFSLNLLINDTKFSKFWRFFPYLSLAPIVLLCVGICFRVFEYGLTLDRILLILISFCISLAYIMQIFKVFSYRIWVLVLILATFFCYFIANPNKIVINSQLSRLYSELNKLSLLDENLSAKSITKKQIFSLKMEDLIKIKDLAYEIEKIDPNFVIKENKILLNIINQGKAKVVVSENFVFKGEIFIENLGKYENLRSFNGEIFRGQSIKFGEFNINLGEHIDRVFAKFGLDTKKLYKEDELKALKDEILHIKFGDYELFMSEIWLEYKDEIGYKPFISKGGIILKRR